MTNNLSQSLFRHTARIPDESGANILTVNSLGELEETTGIPSYYVDEGYPAGP